MKQQLLSLIQTLFYKDTNEWKKRKDELYNHEEKEIKNSNKQFS